MLSNSLGDLLATMDIVKGIDGVEERDQAIIERRQGQENAFLDQVLDLADTGDLFSESANRDSGTKYSDGEVTLDFEDEGYAKTIMDLAQAKGIAQGEIVPERLKSGSIRLHIMPHVFASAQMEDVRFAIGLGVSEDQVADYDGLIKDIEERANPNHSTTGKFTSALRGGRKGSRSFQFSAPDDSGVFKGNKRKANDPKNTFNKPQYRKNRQFIVRKVPCGRAARPYYRRAAGLAPIAKNKLYIRCHDGQRPSWVREMTDSKQAAKALLASALRDNLSKG